MEKRTFSFQGSIPGRITVGLLIGSFHKRVNVFIRKKSTCQTPRAAVCLKTFEILSNIKLVSMNFYTGGKKSFPLVVVDNKVTSGLSFRRGFSIQTKLHPASPPFPARYYPRSNEKCRRSLSRKWFRFSG